MTEESLTFSDYQKEAAKTATYPNRGNTLVYPTLGLTGEAGEVAEKVKKLIRDTDGEVTEEFREALTKELGDVLWYVAALSYELGVDLEEVARINVQKLRSRLERGKIAGSGDDR